MDNREIEKRIHAAVCSATPDKLDDIMKACGIGEQTEQQPERKTVYLKPKKKKPAYKVFGSVAAALIICIAGVLAFGKGGASEAAAIIGLDVNPSIQLSVDDNGKVIEASAVNKDGEKILDDMSLAGTDMKVAANAIVGSMLQQGFLNDISNSILVSVQAKDSAKGTSLQEALSNISRHANAGNVEIRFVDGIDDFRFIIKDDGKGFSEEEVELKNKQSAKKHYGVSNIKERVELLGGTVNFISEGGTTIAITIKDSVR